MVYFFKIRGGPCQGKWKGLVTLESSDICCYVGRDKFENEHLIQYAWPGDIWFHVDGLSSAHVYFRLVNPEKLVLAGCTDGPTTTTISVDDLPEDSVYDMMQICKDNSIAGCKLKSCRMVYTEARSNLKKTFDMADGTVTFHDTKQCRYRRCDKDRKRVNELNKTKSADITVDYYAEMKKNERRIIESRKQVSRAAAVTTTKTASSSTSGGDAIQYIEKTTRRGGGDEESGIDAGLAALEGVAIGTSGGFVGNRLDPSSTTGTSEPIHVPIWKQEMIRRMTEPLSQEVSFLLERGYTREEASSIVAKCITSSTQVQGGISTEALQRLYQSIPDDAARSISENENIDHEALKAARIEEKEVLLALYEYDEAAAFANKTDEASLNASLPVSAFDVPERYHCDDGESPPPLCLEVYVDGSSAPHYPLEPPILAVVGGGLSVSQLKVLTSRLRREATTRLQEAGGEPMPLIFDLLTYCAEEANQMVEQEGEELERIRLEKEQERKAQAAAAAAAQKEKASPVNGQSMAFQTEDDRRSYAQSIAAQAMKGGTTSSGTTTSPTKPSKGRKHYNTGVSDQSLIDDLFG